MSRGINPRKECKAIKTPASIPTGVLAASPPTSASNTSFYPEGDITFKVGGLLQMASPNCFFNDFRKEKAVYFRATQAQYGLVEEFRFELKLWPSA